MSSFYKFLSLYPALKKEEVFLVWCYLFLFFPLLNSNPATCLLAFHAHKFTPASPECLVNFYKWLKMRVTLSWGLLSQSLRTPQVKGQTTKHLWPGLSQKDLRMLYLREMVYRKKVGRGEGEQWDKWLHSHEALFSAKWRYILYKIRWILKKK